MIHIEHNIYDNLIGIILLNLDEKNKGNFKVCLDLKEIDIRQELHPKELANYNIYISPICYIMYTQEKRSLPNISKKY